MPKLSVIVPVYNTEKYLRECIDSILAQTFTDFELILVDDGSTDRSGAICDEYAQQDGRVRVIHQPNGGVTRARKNGAANSCGEYVTYVDSDDWIDPDTYGYMMSMIEKHGADVGAFAMWLEKCPPAETINCVESGYYSKQMLQERVYPQMLFDYSQNRSSLIASLCNKLIKKEILQKAILGISNDLSYGEDAISAYLCLLNASAAYFCNRTFYHYRDNPVSLTHVNTSVMEKRIIALDHEMRHQFSAYEAVMSNQIDGHITRHAVEQVRSVLLYATDKSVSERCQTARAFSEHPQIATAIKNAYPNIRDKKEKIKVFLIRAKQFRLLFLLFHKV